MTRIVDPEYLVTTEAPRRLVLTAEFEPVDGRDRFQPAGFPEIGHVIYDAPRNDNEIEKICIVDSAASMANHLESVCVFSRFDPTPAEELALLPYLRCVTDAGWPDVQEGQHQVVVTSLTEGHRIASTYFLGGRRLESGSPSADTFEVELREQCGVLDLGTRAHPPPEAWWRTFRTLFGYDPNSLVHGVLFPQWQVKIARVLTAHLEAFGAGRVDSSGVKFDRLGKTTSGQPIFAADEETAREIRATFVLDLALLRSFGRGDAGLGTAEKQALAALALWKIGQLLGGPFRYRSGCDLECLKLSGRTNGAETTELDADELAQLNIASFLNRAVDAAAEENRPVAGVTDVYWPSQDLYKAGSAEQEGEAALDQEEAESDTDELGE